LVYGGTHYVGECSDSIDSARAFPRLWKRDALYDFLY